MRDIIALGFDFSLDKFASPVVIIGMVLMLLSIFLVAGSNKIDEAIRAKRKKKSELQKSDDESLSNKENQDEEANTNYKKQTYIDNNKVDEAGEIYMFKHKDGSLNYYFLIKVVGLLFIIASAIMIIVGMK